MKLEDIQKQIDSLIVQCKNALKNKQQLSSGPSMRPEDWAGLRSAGLSFIEQTFGREHSYYKEFNTNLKGTSIYYGENALGILNAMHQQIKNGWLESTKGLVSADIFADFLEMAEHLLEQNYKDAAAVMIGGVLEEHLRQLSTAASLPIEDIVNGKTVPKKRPTH